MRGREIARAAFYHTTRSEAEEPSKQAPLPRFLLSQGFFALHCFTTIGLSAILKTTQPPSFKYNIQSNSYGFFACVRCVGTNLQLEWHIRSNNKMKGDDLVRAIHYFTINKNT